MIRRLYIKVTLKLLLLVVTIGKSSKLGKCLQNKRCSLHYLLMLFHTVISSLFSWQSAKLVTFLHLKIEFHRSYILTLITNFSMVVAKLPIMAKLNVILKSEFLNTWEFRHVLGKELKVMMILPIQTTFYSAITGLILKISPFSLTTTTTLKFP